MAFWSGETLALRLPSLITNFQPGRIDCAAYTLTVGVDAFITEDEVIVGEPRKGVRFTLGPGESFKIPPGQFAFLTTEEVISVPADALAFISMKATYKFKGLVNVSGFHVDPGWKGPLVFSVFNAGPAAVHLRQGLELFLIWFSGLDQSTKMVYQPKPGKVGLRDELMSNMSGQVFSPMNLGRQLSDVKDKQVELVHELASFKKVVYSAGGILAAFLVSFVIMMYTLVLEPIRDLIINEASEHGSSKTKDISPPPDAQKTILMPGGSEQLQGNTSVENSRGKNKSGEPHVVPPQPIAIPPKPKPN